MVLLHSARNVLSVKLLPEIACMNENYNYSKIERVIKQWDIKGYMYIVITIDIVIVAGIIIFNVKSFYGVLLFLLQACLMQSHATWFVYP